MKRYKRSLLILIAFVAGFVVHMYFFSDILPETFVPARPKAAQNTRAVLPTPEFGKSVVYSEYSQGSFNPKTIVSKVGNHIKIRNIDKTEAIWLTSDAEFLKTPRPYRLSEEIDVVPNKSGTFTVTNKLKEEAKLTVIIKP